MKAIYNHIFTIMFFTLIGSSFAGVRPIAHRGASAYAPENTLSSINKALELKSSFIEIDVHMTADGEIVAIHDSTLDRTSNASGKISDYPLSKLKEFDFGSWFGREFENERIPTLKEVLEAIDGRAVLIIELKYGGERYEKIEEEIVELVASLGLERHVILKSFSYKILNKFESIAPDIERLYCTFWGNNWLTVDNFLRFKGIFDGASFQYLQVHKYFLSKDLIEKAHERNIKVVVWDVHDIESMKEFSSLNVDFIETDNPDLVLGLK